MLLFNGGNLYNRPISSSSQLLTQPQYFDLVRQCQLFMSVAQSPIPPPAHSPFLFVLLYPPLLIVLPLSLLIMSIFILWQLLFDVQVWAIITTYIILQAQASKYIALTILILDCEYKDSFFIHVLIQDNYLFLITYREHKLNIQNPLNIHINAFRGRIHLKV